MSAEAITPTRGGGGALALHSKLFNAIVDVCLVYGMDELTQELEIKETGVRNRRGGLQASILTAFTPPPLPPQSIQDSFSALLQRTLKLQFLQVIAPNCVYPQRGSSHGLNSPTLENALLPSQIAPQKKFRMKDVGLAWEAVDTLHLFIYPGVCLG